jgi:hypothetical protein
VHYQKFYGGSERTISQRIPFYKIMEKRVLHFILSRCFNHCGHKEQDKLEARPLIADQNGRVI